MNIIEKEKIWIEKFFNKPNKIIFKENYLISSNLDNKFNDIVSESNKWLEFYLIDFKQIVIPFTTNEFSYWYTCTFDKIAKKRIKDELESFLGAYSEIKEYFGTSKEFEKILLRHFGENNIIKIIPNKNYEKPFLDSLNQYRILLEKKPEIKKEINTSFNLTRYNFEKSLSLGNKTDAEKYLEDMKRTGRLDEQNKKFLQIQLWARLGNWKNILEYPYLTSLYDLPIPKQTFSDILEAVYNKFLYSYEKNNDFDGIIKSFEKNIIIDYGKLLKSSKGVRNSHIIKLFILKELRNDDINIAHCNSLKENYPITDSKGLDFINKLLDLKFGHPKLIQSSYEEEALRRFEEEDFDSAFELFLKYPQDIDVEKKINLVKNILRCVEEINSNNTNIRAWEYLENIPSEIFEKLPPASTKKFNNLENKMSCRKIKNLHEIINYYFATNLERKDDTETIKLIEDTFLEWNINYYISDYNNSNLNDLIKSLNKLASQNPNLYKKHLLHRINDKFFDNFENNPNLEKLAYSIICEDFIQFEPFNKDDLKIFFEFYYFLLKNRLIDEKYNNLITAFDLIFKEINSPDNIDLVLDISEIISFYSSASQKNISLGLFSKSIFPFIINNKHRISEWFAIEQLAKDFSLYEDYIKQHIPTKISTEEETENLDILKNKIIAIYTLTDQAAYRAKKKIESVYKGVKVEINNDKENTEALKNLAKRADIFIFCWKSSKHQAFYSIKENFKKHKPNNFLEPEGKGSNSIFRILKQNINNLVFT